MYCPTSPLYSPFLAMVGKLFLYQVLLANRRRLIRYHGCHITLRSRNYTNHACPPTLARHPFRETEALHT